MEHANRRKRRIRSFVRRPGRLTPSQERALQSLWPVYGLDASGESIDPAVVFARSAPVVLEIGFGNGETFIAQAAADESRNYLGIEVHEPGVGHCLLRARDAGVANVRVIRDDAMDVLARLPNASLHRINVYFPDPWPKKRHHKRRLIQAAFLQRAARTLVPGGELCIATDWAHYAEQIDEVLRASDKFRIVESTEHAGDSPIDRPTTKFERRGLGRGHRIRDWRARRLAP